MHGALGPGANYSIKGNPFLLIPEALEKLIFKSEKEVTKFLFNHYKSRGFLVYFTLFNLMLAI